MNKCARASNENRKDSSLTKGETKQHCSTLGEQPLELVEALLSFTSRGEIQILEDQIASTRLKPLVLDPEDIRLSQDASDSQRARLSQLGYGVLGAPHSDPAFVQVLNNDDFVGAERAKSDAASAQFVRTSALVQAGVMSRDKLEAAKTATQTAAKEFRERENLIQSAKAGSEEIAYAESAIRRDGERARAERAAELAALDARLSEFRTSLLQLHEQSRVVAPFAGTVVYRHPTPSLAEDGKVILALAKGPASSLPCSFRLVRHRC
jgi:hypothetical protein